MSHDSIPTISVKNSIANQCRNETSEHSKKSSTQYTNPQPSTVIKTYTNSVYVALRCGTFAAKSARLTRLSSASPSMRPLASNKMVFLSLRR